MEEKITPAIKPESEEANNFPIFTLKFFCSSQINSFKILISKLYHNIKNAKNSDILNRI